MSQFNSCIYSGFVTHRRFKPKRHFFTYKTFSLLIDLDEIENLVKNNRRLKQISYSRKTAVYTIQRHSLLEIVKALQRLDNKYETFAPIKKQTICKATRIIDKELLTPLEETRLAIEEIIIPNHKILDLLPRTSSVRKLQRDLVKHYQLNSTNVGNKLNRRVRIYPN